MVDGSKAGRFRNDVWPPKSNQIGPLSCFFLNIRQPSASRAHRVRQGATYEYLAHGMTNQVDNIQAEVCLNAKLYINYKHKYTHSPSGTMSGTLWPLRAAPIRTAKTSHFGTFRSSLMGSNKTDPLPDSL